MVKASHLVIFKDHANFDATNKIVHFQYEDAITEEIPSLIIRLSAKRGRFLTKTPIVNHFDRIFARCTDRNGKTVEGVFEITKIKPMQKESTNLQVELICTHQSWYVWQDHFSKQFQRQSGFEVIEDICNNYNVNPGLSQPTIQNHTVVFNVSTKFGNAMSQATFNDYDFGNAEKKDYDGILETIDRLGSPIPAGGEFEFFEVRFVSAYNHTTGLDIDKINLSLPVSGFKNGVLVTIDKGDLLNRVMDTDGNLEAITGTNILAWGSQDGDSLPTDTQQYFSEQEKFLAAKFWKDLRVYKKDMRVQDAGVFYKALADHTASAGNKPPSANWVSETFSSTRTYSPWTNNNAQDWINSGLAPKDAGTETGRAGIFDRNVIVRDDNHRRTICDFVGTNPASITASLIPAGVYRGFRVLVNGTGAGLFSGNDATGKAFTNNIAQLDVDGNWFVFIVSKNDFEVVDKENGKAFTKIAGTWTHGAYNILGVFIAGQDFDCMHRYDFLNATTPDFGNTQGIVDGADGANSAVRVKFRASSVPTNPDFVFLNDQNLNKVFWGLVISFPFPTTENAIPFGAPTFGEHYRPETLDRNNMHLTHKNNRGFNLGLESEDLGPLSAFRFWEKLIVKNELGAILKDGDFKSAVTFIDTSDNVVTAEKNHAHNDNFEEITTQLSETGIYRARPGLAFLPLNELEVLNRFEWRNLKYILIHTLDAYDTDGRYAGVLSRLFNPPTISLGTVGGSWELQIDMPHFVKPVLVTTQEQSVQASKPARNLQPQFLQRPQIFNRVQLKSDAKSMLEIHQFKRVEYNIRTVWRCDIDPGEHFYFTHTKMINNTVDSLPNTEKLVLKKAIYTSTKGRGTGGRTRLLMGSKRFIAP